MPSFNFTIENDDGEDEVLEVECDVTSERDPYGTGDSPTAYYVENIIINYGEIDFNDLHSHYQQKIQDRAVDLFQG